MLKVQKTKELMTMIFAKEIGLLLNFEACISSTSLQQFFLSNNNRVKLYQIEQFSKIFHLDIIVNFGKIKNIFIIVETLKSSWIYSSAWIDDLFSSGPCDSDNDRTGCLPVCVQLECNVVPHCFPHPCHYLCHSLLRDFARHSGKITAYKL